MWMRVADADGRRRLSTFFEMRESGLVQMGDLLKNRG